MKKIKKESKHFQVIEKGIVLNFVKEPEGGYTITVPSLPGCISYGRTFEEAMAMIKDAMKGYLEVVKEEGLLVPEEIQEQLKIRSTDINSKFLFRSVRWNTGIAFYWIFFVSRIFFANSSL